MSDLERRLRALAPAAAPDRDRTLFEAGRRSAPRPVFWPLATLASSACAIGLGLCLVLPKHDAPPPPAPTATTVPLTTPPARLLEEQVLEHGLDGLGPTPPLDPAPAFPKGDF
ncbi:MAG: hypothetical protein ACRC33_22405 [Gemmataceae bacterium]